MSRSPPRPDGDPTETDAVRNASLLLGQRTLDGVHALVFVALIPRLLGPADFGRFALLTSVALWFALLSGLGSTQLLSRFVPVMLLKGERADSRLLLGNLLAIRILSGSGAATTYLLFLLAWLSDLPILLVAPVAASIAVRSAANVLFAYLLGVNQAARWGAGELTRRWSSLVLLLVGTLSFGLTGACVGVLLAELCVLALGLYWVRPHLALGNMRLARTFIAPYLRYNLVFFGSNLLFAVSLRAGEPVVRAATESYAEVGYFGLAASAFALAGHGTWQLLMAFVPMLSRLRAQGRLEAAREWASRLLRVLAASAVVGCAGALLLSSELVPLLAGDEFEPAAALLPPIALAILLHAAASVGRMMVLILDRPRLALSAALAQAATFIGLGLPLGERYEAMGVVLAFVAATAVHALVFLGGVHRVAPLRLGPTVGVVALGGIVLPFTLLAGRLPLLASGLPSRIGLFVFFVAGYAAALRATRLVTGEEVSALRRGLRRRIA